MVDQRVNRDKFRKGQKGVDGATERGLARRELSFLFEPVFSDA